jgi:hypothetical protein
MVQYSTIPMVVSIGLTLTCSNAGVGSDGIVFRRENRASLSVLETALRWAVDSNLKVIHLSPGTVRGESGQLLSDLCRKACESDLVFFHDGSIEFRACGHPRPLPEMAPGSNFSGSSFAAAHVTVRVVSLLESHPLADYANINTMLIGEAHGRTL